MDTAPYQVPNGDHPAAAEITPGTAVLGPRGERRGMRGATSTVWLDGAAPLPSTPDDYSSDRAGSPSRVHMLSLLPAPTP